MSNLTRLTKNNEDLGALKTSIDNLPDYQDITPIYSQNNGINIVTKTAMGLGLFGNIINISQYGKYIAVGCSGSSHLLEFSNNEFTYLCQVSSQSGNNELYLLGYNNDYIFVLNVHYSNSYIKKINISTKEITTIESLLSRVVYTETVNNNYFSIYDNYTWRKYLYKIPETGDIEYTLQSSGTYSGTWHTDESLGDNLYLYRTSNSNNADLYLTYLDINTDTLELRSYKSINAKTNNLIGGSIKYRKFFGIDGIYEINSDFTLGTKLKNLIINNTQTTPVFYPFGNTNANQWNNFLHQVSNSDVFITTGLISSGKQYLLEFNNTTNEFNCIGEFNPTFNVQNDFHYTPNTGSGNNYILNPNLQEIGFELHGESFYYGLSKASIQNNDILSGYETNDRFGNLIVGSMPNNGALNITPSTSSQTIPAGYTSGGTVSGDANLVQANIRAGVSIFGVEGNLEPDKPDQTKTVTPSASQQVIEPDTGYELASVTINPVTASIDSNIIAENIKSGVTILGVTGTYTGEENDNSSPESETIE